MKNADKLRAVSTELYDELYDAEFSALQRLKKSARWLDALEKLGVTTTEARAGLDEAVERVQAVADLAQHLRDSSDADPEQIDAMLGRLDLISRLKQKYGGTVEDVLARAQKIRGDLEKILNHEEQVETLQKKVVGAYKTLLKTCKILSASRKKASEKFSVNVAKELKDLGFTKAKFEVQLVAELDAEQKERPTAQGLEQVEFMFSANVGLPVQALKSVASGGEMSRLMLAIKKVFADADPVPTLIFDEIDAGIGGAMGHIIGQKLNELGRYHQVILVTHLAQIAAFAKNHLNVQKIISGKMTQAKIQLLSKEDRIKEIARMMGGTASLKSDPSAISLQHAKELLTTAQKK